MFLFGVNLKFPDENYPYICWDGKHLVQTKGQLHYDRTVTSITEFISLFTTSEKTVILNDQYTAKINYDEKVVEVGCQKIAFEKVKELYDGIVNKEIPLIKEMTYEEWMTFLPHHYVESALKYVRKDPNKCKSGVKTLHEALHGAFTWCATEEGHDYWSSLHKKLTTEYYNKTKS